MCCRSGSAADTQAIADIVRYYLGMHAYARSPIFFQSWENFKYLFLFFFWAFKKRVEHGGEPDVKTAATFFQQLCYSNKDNLSAGIIVAGWDKVEGGVVYNIPLGGSLHKQPFAIGGSGSTYIYGYCDAHYKENMTKEQCIEFVRNCEISFFTLLFFYYSSSAAFVLSF